MNAQTNTQIVNPVFAVLAIPKYNHQQRRQETGKQPKKRRNFEALFQTACDLTDDSLFLNDPGCYGKDAKPVVGIVSSFNHVL